MPVAVGLMTFLYVVCFGYYLILHSRLLKFTHNRWHGEWPLL